MTSSRCSYSPTTSYPKQNLIWMQSPHVSATLVTSPMWQYMCVEEIGLTLIFSPKEPSYHHSVTTNKLWTIFARNIPQCISLSVGTFGWWAGILAGGDVIYYSEPSEEGTKMFEEYVAGDFVLPEWIPLPWICRSITVQTTVPNSFDWLKMWIYNTIHCSLFLSAQWGINQHWCR